MKPFEPLEDTGKWRARLVGLVLLALLVGVFGRFVLFVKANPPRIPSLPMSEAEPPNVPVVAKTGTLPTSIPPQSAPVGAASADVVTAAPTIPVTGIGASPPAITPTLGSASLAPLDRQPIIRSLHLHQSPEAMQAEIVQAFGQYDGKRQAGVVFTFGYVTTSSQAIEGNRIAHELNELLMQTLPGIFVKDSTVFQDYHWIQTGLAGEARVEVYFVSEKP